MDRSVETLLGNSDNLVDSNWFAFSRLVFSLNVNLASPFSVNVIRDGIISVFRFSIPG